jgi:acylphosphatase
MVEGGQRLADSVRVHVWIRGRVQGVWFRDTCRTEARIAGVAGWVGNRIDGRVEAVFEGPSAAVERMVAWSRAGPPRALVTEVVERPERPVGLTGFVIR